MNARVLLLVLVTSLFMAAWDGDQAAMEAAIARRSDRQATALLALTHSVITEEDSTVPHKHTMTVATTNTVTTTEPDGLDVVVQSAAVDAIAGKADAPIADIVPLPPGIAVGEYQAVDQTGKTVRLSVTATIATGSNARDFYTVDAQDGTRWYLIRIAASN